MPSNPRSSAWMAANSSSDLRTKTLRIPAATVGSVIGYEIEQELRPYVMVDEWEFQDTIPVREAHYTLQLPHGWSYKTNWLNQAEEHPVGGGRGAVALVGRRCSGDSRRTGHAAMAGYRRQHGGRDRASDRTGPRHSKLA